MKKLGAGAVVLVLVGWLVLILSTHGLLVWSTGPLPPKTASGQATLECTFFTGLELVTLGYYYSPDNWMAEPSVRD
jgi:hypothetical protein